MSILIRGMEMPTSPVLFCIHPDGKVFADLEGGWREYKVAPIPSHGRLIDEDVLIKTAHNQWPLPIDFLKLLELVPTVIPADDPKEE